MMDITAQTSSIEPPASPEPAEPTRTMTCPTCGARQVQADTCRRCQSDLRMVSAVRQQLDALRGHCLMLLSDRRLKRATLVAHRCRELSHDEDTARLLATCYLLQGDFAAALRVYCETASVPSGRS